MFDKQVVFMLAGQQYSFNSLNVITVDTCANIRGFANAPECIVGLAELRNELVPVCSLRTKFNAGRDSAESQAIIYVDTSWGHLGCIVDSVVEIGAVTEDVQMNLPFVIQSEGTGYIEGIVKHRDNLITVINQDKLLTNEEVIEIKAALKGMTSNQEGS